MWNCETLYLSYWYIHVPIPHLKFFLISKVIKIQNIRVQKHMVTAKTLITKSCLELEVCITKLLNKIKWNPNCSFLMLYYNHDLLYCVNDDTDRSICSQYKYCTSVVADLATCSHLQIHVLYKSCCWLVYLCVVMYRYMYWIRVVADLSICSQYRYCASVVADLSISILYNSFCPNFTSWLGQHRTSTLPHTARWSGRWWWRPQTPRHPPKRAGTHPSCSAGS